MERGENDTLSNLTNRSKKSFFKRIVEGRNALIVASVLIVLLIIFFVWIFVVDKYEGCKSWECFNENLAACQEARFAGGKEVIFGYTIEGREGSECVVNVEFLQGEITGRDARRLTGQSMTCRLPDGIIMLPESDLERCTGPLKEQLQEQIIDQLHNFIIQNLGQINKELLNPLNYQ